MELYFKTPIFFFAFILPSYYRLLLILIHGLYTDRTRLIHGLYTAYIRVIYGVGREEVLS
jgi:hypothetical protein